MIRPARQRRLCGRGAGNTLTDESHYRSTAEDIAFALRVRQGDHDAFRALYERYGNAVLGLAQSVVHDRSAAEDITHDVVLCSWRTRCAFEPSRGLFVAWILRVTRNRSIDILRKRRDLSFGNTRTTQGGETIDPNQWLAEPTSAPGARA